MTARAERRFQVLLSYSFAMSSSPTVLRMLEEVGDEVDAEAFDEELREGGERVEVTGLGGGDVGPCEDEV